MSNNSLVGSEMDALIVQECKLRGYSQKTIESYLYHIRKFIESKNQPRKYLLSIIEKSKSYEKVRSASFAIKFYLNLKKKDSE